MAEEAVPRIGPREMHAQLGRGEAVALDTRSADAYRTAHIPGARHMPKSDVATRVGDLAPGVRLIFYCT